jgi:hypothetical protein
MRVTDTSYDLGLFLLRSAVSLVGEDRSPSIRDSGSPSTGGYDLPSQVRVAGVASTNDHLAVPPAKLFSCFAG